MALSGVSVLFERRRAVALPAATSYLICSGRSQDSLASGASATPDPDFLLQRHHLLLQ
jgi:hypothetical protein